MIVPARLVRLLRHAARTAALLAVLPPLALAAPAHAARRVVVDGNDSTALADLYRLTVKNGPVVKVVLRFDDLVRPATRAGQSAGIFIDTDRSRPGPEFGLGGGLNDGTDYQLGRMRRWTWVGDPLRCTYEGEFDWRKDTATYLVSPECLGDYDRIRVGVEASEYVEDEGVSDWLLGEKRFSAWVPRS